jgi:hypothetical protein
LGAQAHESRQPEAIIRAGHGGVIAGFSVGISWKDGGTDRAMQTMSKGPANLKIGFVILSHASSADLGRLVRRLDTLYDLPPIVIHHDQFQSPLPLDRSSLGKNVSVVKPNYRTRWAHISLVDAFLTGLEMLYEQYSPDWFYLLSTSCYPVAGKDRVLADIGTTGCDAFMDAFEVSGSGDAPAQYTAEELGEFVTNPCLVRTVDGANAWLQTCHARYVPNGESKFPVFNETFKCFAGDQWFSANAKSARILIDSRRARCDLFYQYVNSFCPDESYYQTVLANQPDVIICRSHKRYADWWSGDSYPRILDIGDLQKILDSGCHFARKISAAKSNQLLDALDRISSSQP